MPKSVVRPALLAYFILAIRARHPRFGTGQIIKITGQNLTVDFGHAGCKQIRHKYVKAAEQSPKEAVAIASSFCSAGPRIAERYSNAICVWWWT